MPSAFQKCLYFDLLISVACCLFPYHAYPQCASGDAAKMVGRIVRHELDLAPSQGRWMYVAEYKENGIRIKARKIQTDDGIFTWLISKDGVSLSPADIEKQEVSLKDQASNPSFLGSNRRAMRNDDARINTLLADLPDSVQFGCLTQSGATATVHFAPKSGCNPFNVLKCIVAGMSGSLRLDLKDMRLLAASGSEKRDLSILLGIGRIYKGELREPHPDRGGAWHLGSLVCIDAYQRTGISAGNNCPECGRIPELLRPRSVRTHGARRDPLPRSRTSPGQVTEWRSHD